MVIAPDGIEAQLLDQLAKVDKLLGSSEVLRHFPALRGCSSANSDFEFYFILPFLLASMAKKRTGLAFQPQALKALICVRIRLRLALEVLYPQINLLIH